MKIERYVLFVLFVFLSAHSRTGFSALYGDVVITEVMATPTYDDDFDEFIELYNNTSSPIDITGWKIIGSKDTDDIVPWSEKGYSGLENIEPLTTDSYIIPPKSYAVILDQEYPLGAQPYAFPSNAVIFTLSDTAFDSSGLSLSKLTNIKLIDNFNNVISSWQNCHIETEDGQSIILKKVSAGESADNFTATDHPSPAMANPTEDKAGYITPESFIVKSDILRFSIVDSDYSGNEISVRIKSQSDTEGITVPAVKYGSEFWGSVNLSEVASGFKMIKVKHGDDILISYYDTGLNAERVAKARWQESVPLSTNYQSVIINELVSDPQKDYSTTWDGTDGKSTISDTDDWIELVNRTSNSIDISGWFFMRKTTASEKVKEITSYQVKYSRSDGGQPSSMNMSSGDYWVVSMGSSFSVPNEGAMILYDGNPYKRGRIVDAVELGDEDVMGDGNQNNAPSGRATSLSLENEAVARYPDSISGNPANLFVKQRATFGEPNGPDTGTIILDKPYYRGEETAEITIVDCNSTESNIMVLVKSDSDQNGINMTLNRVGPFYKGHLHFSTTSSSNSTIKVKNGDRVTIIYEDTSPHTQTSAETIWVAEGYYASSPTATLNQMTIYPNPFVSGENTKIYIGNLPENTAVEIYNTKGKLIKRLTTDSQGKAVWDIIYDDVPPGIYLAVVKGENGERIIRKIAVVR